MNNINTWTGLPMQESIRMIEDRDKWTSMSMVWPTFRSRTAKEQNRTLGEVKFGLSQKAKTKDVSLNRPDQT